MYRDHKPAFLRSVLLRAFCSGLIPIKPLVVKKSCSKIAELPNVHDLSVDEKVSPLEIFEFELFTGIAFVPRYVQRHAGGRENIFFFPSVRYVDCSSLTYATNKSKTLKLQYVYRY